jgi:RNA polymerase sigma-70 factor (ECF subfamily)
VLDLQTSTTTCLLEGLFDAQNHAVWREFDLRYRPIAYGCAKRLGLSDADADEVVQDTLSRFLEEYRQGKYDRGRGRLRSWIVAILKFRVAGFRREQANRRHWRGESAMDQLPDRDLEALWEKERQAVILRQALDELRERSHTSEKTIAAFEAYVLRQRPPDEVAVELDMTIADVYMAKNRVAERLRAIVQRLESLFDDG